MDLDQLIHDADPARGLRIAIPEPFQPARQRRGRRGVAAPVALVFSLAITALVVVLALNIGGGRPHPAVSLPARLPFAATATRTAAARFRPHSARIVQTFPDPIGGPAWGLRTIRTRNGKTCVQAGRTESGAIGAIGLDGAYHDDMRFHPFALEPSGSLDCVPDDARGHAFINIDAVNTGASATEQTCLRNDDALPREHCPTAALRDLYYGLLGPDATSITYLTAHGRHAIERTRGPDGAYLVVRTLAAGPCTRARMQHARAMSSCDYDSQGVGIDPALRAGDILEVSYRDGHECRLPAPDGTIVPFAQCPVVGYVAPSPPRFTARHIAARITVRKLPAHAYCARVGIYRPANLPIPCNRTVPPGYTHDPTAGSRPGHTGAASTGSLLIYVSWIAHGAVDRTDRSSYNISLDFPRGCGAGGEGTGTQTRIHVGERITRAFYVPTTCHGTYSGQVTYTPNLGPGGQQGGLASEAPSSRERVLLVGRFTFSIR